MEHDLFLPFRLVGGTSLSLQLGHRISIDIDLFTDTSYSNIDFEKIDKYMLQSFPYVSGIGAGPVGMGRSYLLGANAQDAIKADIFYTTDPYIQPPLVIGAYRLATVEEIIAMKVDVIQRGGRKKDFWDLHEILPQYTPSQMIALHAQRYPYTHDEQTIRTNFTNFKKADEDFDPHCLRGKYWEIIKYDFATALEHFRI